MSDFDISYSGGWFTRNTHSIADYADYSYFYDKYYGSGCNWLTAGGCYSRQEWREVLRERGSRFYLPVTTPSLRNS